MSLDAFITYFRRFGLLFFLVVSVAVFYFYGGFEMIQWDNIRKMRDQLLMFVEVHPFYTVLIFFGCYTIYTISSIPGLFALDLVAGFLFGRFLGVLLVITGAMIGALLMFLAARYAFYDFFQKKSEGWIYKLRQGFDRNQKSYLFFLRFVPFVPFGIVNIALAFLNVRTWTYFWTTIIGILPISFLHVHVGSSLGKLLENNVPISAALVFNYEIVLAFVGFATLAFLPIAFRRKKS